MKTKSICLVIFLLISSFAFAQSNTIFHENLLKLYPDASSVTWKKDGKNSVANFYMNGFETKVWMNSNAEWLMTSKDIKSLDELPTKVYDAYTYSSYSSWNVINVYWITFPNREEQFAIKVNRNNSSQINELFYIANGDIVKNLDSRNNVVNISPKIFEN